MPTLGPMIFPSQTVDARQVYAYPLYNPVNPPDTYEMLHGGLDVANIVDPVAFIPMSCVRQGALACGFWMPKTRPTFVYARASNIDSNSGGDETSRTRVAGLSTGFRLPWDASTVIFTWSAFFRHDATRYDANADDGGPFREYWDYRVYVDGDNYSGHYGQLPDGRVTNTLPDSTGLDAPSTASVTWRADDQYPGMHLENRWRFVNKVGMLKDQDKGRHSIVISLWPNVYGPDVFKAKTLMPEVSIGVLAFR